MFIRLSHTVFLYMKKFTHSSFVVRERRAERPRTHPSPSHDDDDDDDDDGQYLFNARDATRGRAESVRDDEDSRRETNQRELDERRDDDDE